jgi:site-specific recombinase XerD
MHQALDRMAGLLTDGAHNADSLPWGEVRRQHTAALRALVAERFALRTANKMLSALRGVLKEAWQLGYMGAEDYHRACNVEGVKGSAPIKGRALGDGELLALFQGCARMHLTAGARDAALLAVLVGCGLRRSEAVALDVEHYSPTVAEDASHGVLSVLRAKGNKCRTVPVSNGTKAALDAWLAARGPEAGPLFLPVDRSGRVHVRRMTSQSVYESLRRRARAAGVDTFAPHDLRRTFVSNLLDAGADVSAVQGLAGHANVATTIAYDRRGERAKHKAAALVRIPYVARKGA